VVYASYHRSENASLRPFSLYPHIASILFDHTIKMTPASRVFNPVPEFSFSELYDHTTPSSETPLSESGHLTPLGGSLLSPADIYLANHNMGASRAKQSHQSDAYSQVVLRCRQLEHELRMEKEAHNDLRYVNYRPHTIQRNILDIGQRTEKWSSHSKIRSSQTKFSWPCSQIN
jgi:hypothetical protein